jgi:hypothetical protein
MPNVFVAWCSTEIHLFSCQNIPIARAMIILLSDWLNRQNDLTNRPVILITVNHTDPENGGTMFLRELQYFTRQHGVTSKKIQFQILTVIAVRLQNPLQTATSNFQRAEVFFFGVF